MPGGVLANVSLSYCKFAEQPHLEWNRVSTGFGRGGRASFVSISSEIMLAMRITRSSTAHFSYLEGRILAAEGADLVRLDANPSLLSAAGCVCSGACLLFTPGDSGFKVGLDGEGGMLETGAGTIAVGLGSVLCGGS